MSSIFSCRYAHLERHPVDIVAQDIASRTKILCLDELHVSDVADALILSQVSLFCSTSIPKACTCTSYSKRCLPAMLICCNVLMLNVAAVDSFADS